MGVFDNSSNPMTYKKYHHQNLLRLGVGSILIGGVVGWSLAKKDCKCWLTHAMEEAGTKLANVIIKTVIKEHWKVIIAAIGGGGLISISTYALWENLHKRKN